MDNNELQLREQLLTLTLEQLQNVFINYVKQNHDGAVPDGGSKNCCPPGSCGVCVNGTCIKCG